MKVYLFHHRRKCGRGKWRICPCVERTLSRARKTALDWRKQGADVRILVAKIVGVKGVSHD